MLGWLMAGLALVFGWMSLSMLTAAFKETEEQERARLMKSGIGTLVLTLMGITFAWNSFFPPVAEPPAVAPSPTASASASVP
ncbi:MAG: hypothetical protein CVV27_01285 [Candidatus Melainabacteria bacterium HGW-Melainabacteria-1]|nr:MAG: hypothetical protein CVV27_01285 [Candidatus Melainabacteria bacterium HGW-Melainabacteria-1]